MVECFINRLSSWKSRSLSISGLLTLTKAALSSLPLYYISLFRAPSWVLNILESIFTLFFGGFKENERGLVWVKWKSVIFDVEK